MTTFDPWKFAQAEQIASEAEDAISAESAAQPSSPTVGIPEPFSGYDEMLLETRRIRYQSDINLEKARKLLSDTLAEQSIRKAGMPVMILCLEGYYVPIKPKEPMSEAEIDELNAAVESAYAEYERYSWRHKVLLSLPAALNDYITPSRTSGEAMALFPSDLITDADIAWFNSIFDQLAYLIPPETAPTTVRELERIISQEPYAPPTSMHAMTVGQIVEGLRAAPRPSLPAGITDADLLEIMSDLQFTDDEKAAAQDLHNWVVEQQVAWAEERAYGDLLKAGLAKARVDPLTYQQVAQMLATQPMLATMTFLEKYFHIFSRPAASAVLQTLGPAGGGAVMGAPGFAGLGFLAGGLFGGPVGAAIGAAIGAAAGAVGGAVLFSVAESENIEEMKRVTAQYKEMGESSWEAYALAFENAGTNVALKMYMETILDPTTYIGIGIAPKVFGKVPYLGRFVGAVESGWLAMADAPFEIPRAIASLIPKTPGQAARAYAKQAYIDIQALLARELGGWKAASPEDLLAIGEKIVYLARQMPTEEGNLGVKAGMYALESQRKLINEAKVTEWLAALKREVAVIGEAEITRQTAIDIQRIFDDMWYRLKTPGQAGSEIVAKLTKIGIDIMDTDAAASTITGILTREVETIERGAINLFAGTTSKQVLRNVFYQVSGNRLANLTSPMWKFANQSGQISAFAKGVDKITNWSVANWIDRHLTAPMANQYLLFFNYGTMNIIETGIRSKLGGGDYFLYPRKSHPTAELARFASEMTTAPYDLMAMEQAARLETALVDKSGAPVIYSASFKGVIPGITAPFPEAITKRLPKKSVKLPTGIILDSREGITIELAGRRFNIQSLQHINNITADITAQQRASFLLTKTKHHLAELDPTNVGAIQRAIKDNAYMLNEATAFNGAQKRDMFRVLSQDATIGPDAVLAHDVTLTELQRRKALIDIQPELNKSTEIYSPHREYIAQKVLDGSIFRDINGEMDAVAKSMREYNLLGVEANIIQLRRLTAGLASTQPKNSRELMQQLVYISDMRDAVADRMSQVRSLAQQRAKDLTADERTKFHTESFKQLQRYIDETRHQVNYLTDLMKANINGEEFKMDWSKVKFVHRLSQDKAESLPSALKDRITELFDDLPLEMKGILKAVEFDDNLLKEQGYRAFYTGDGVIHLQATSSHMQGILSADDIHVLNHEMLHAVQEQRIASGDYQFYFDLLDSLGMKGSPQWEIIEEAQAKKLSSEQMYRLEIARWPEHTPLHHGSRPSEIMSNNFGWLWTTPQDVPEGFIKWVDTHLPRKLSYPKLTRAQKELSLQLIDNYSQRMNALLMAREAERDITESLISAKPKFKSKELANAWWNDFYNQRNVPWDKFRAMDAQLTRQVEAIRFAMTSRVKQKPITLPDTVSGLTPAHVSYIFGITGDDLSRYIISPDTMTLFPKHKFIAIVQGRVDTIANPLGKTAESVGFTEQAIGHVYDQLLRSAGLEPSIAMTEPMVAAMQQLEGIRKELIRIESTRRIPQESYVAYKRYINAVVNDLRKMPIFKKPVALSPEDMQFLSKVGLSPEELAALTGEAAAKLNIPESLQNKLSNYIGQGFEAPLKPPVSYKPSVAAIEARTFWNENLEQNALRRNPETSAGVFLSKRLENAGDVIREIGKPGADIRYIEEKLTAIERSLGDADWAFPLNPEEIETVRDMQLSLFEFDRMLRGAGPDELTVSAVELAKQVLNRNNAQVKSTVANIRKLSEVIKPAEMPVLAPTPRSTWLATKDEAMAMARTDYEKTFTDYSNPNAVDAFMRLIFPFWQYEYQRYYWLPRTFLRQPGVLTGLGRYMNYTDSGYIPIPGTDMQANLARGTVFAGGMRRLMLRDYPEYYDAFPGMEVLDYINRIGFYPGIANMLPIVAFGYLANRKPEWGELLPAWAKTGFDLAVQVAPSKAANFLTQTIFPDRFRDYLTIVTLSGEGHDGLDIYYRMKSNQLAEEEKALWARATKRATGLKGALFEQSAVLRLRPAEYTQFLANSRKLIEEMTGVPVSVQEEISQRYPVTGKRLSDYAHLDILQQKIVNEVDAFERWRGITAPLTPSAWQEEDRLVKQYYDTIESLYDDARSIGQKDAQGKVVGPSIKELNRQLVSGEISGGEWVSRRGDMLGKLSSTIDAIASKVYPTVPKTLAERERRYAERRYLPPVYSPDQEILYTYYDLKPEYKWDEDLGKSAYDFDTYYAMIDAIIESLSGEYRQIFVERIQYAWTPLERLYWDVSRELFRPYRAARNIIVRNYSPDQQRIINRAAVASGTEREALMAELDPRTGSPLYSQFQSELRLAHTNLRKLSPTLDAWLNFFGRVDKLLTPESQEIYEKLSREFLTEDMIG